MSFTWIVYVSVFACRSVGTRPENTPLNRKCLCSLSAFPVSTSSGRNETALVTFARMRGIYGFNPVQILCRSLHVCAFKTWAAMSCLDISTSHRSLSLPLPALSFWPFFLVFPLVLEVMMNVSFMAGHLTAVSSQCLDQLEVFEVTSDQCKRKLLWPKVTGALICDCELSDKDSISCSIRRQQSNVCVWVSESAPINCQRKLLWWWLG